jgi:hypothetical protein
MPQEDSFANRAIVAQWEIQDVGQLLADPGCLWRKGSSWGQALRESDIWGAGGRIVNGQSPANP